MCYLKYRAHTYEYVRQRLCIAMYPEIIALLSHPTEQPDFSEFPNVAHLAKENAIILEDAGYRRADDLRCTDICTRIRDGPSQRDPNKILKPGGKFGFIYDGTYYRQLLNGNCPGAPTCQLCSQSKPCIDTATYAASIGYCSFRAENGEPMKGIG